ncbi:MAG: SpoIIE family protein phosphatase [Lautropia sp.]
MDDTSTGAASTVAGPRRGFDLLLAPSIWLSHQLSFTRKYILIGVVVLLALSALSVPLWQHVSHASEVAELERAGLRSFRESTQVLSMLVRQRDDGVLAEGPAQPASRAALNDAIARLRDGRSAELVEPLAARWRQLQGLPADASPALRFGAYNGVIQALVGLIQTDAQAFRLNVDPDLDAVFAMLTGRLPQLLDTLGKQQVAVRLNADDLTPYVLGAQVFLTESIPALRHGLAQLLAVRPMPGQLQHALDQLLAGIEQQQDAADRTVDAPQAWNELRIAATRNEALADAFIARVTEAADASLADRITQLTRTRWIIGGLLVGALAAIGYLFAGIYASTRQSLRRLAQGTADFCAGRLDARIRLDTHDELVLVARNFNTVAEEFGRLLEVIREQNESRERELAHQVQARTAELADKNEQLSQAGRRVQEELGLARDMQLAILPQQFPDEPGWAVHASMLPARELGGDFYDVFELPDGRCGVLVADVSGKGVAAAFFMAVSRTVLLDLATTGVPPAQVLAQANDLLCQRNPLDLFVTVCYAVYDPGNGELVYASAGHPAPLLRGAEGDVRVLPSRCELALAVVPGACYTDGATRLEPGATLLLYTDGITEALASDHSAYGEQRLQQWLARTGTGDPAQRVAALVEDVHAFVGAAEASDDLTCLLLTRKTGGTPMKSGSPIVLHNKVLLLDHQMPSRLDAIADLARRVEAALPDRGDLAFSANLCLEELITNTIQHGLQGRSDGRIDVRMSISDEWLEIVLKDDAPRYDPFVETPDPDLELGLEDRPIGGLGVHLVKQLMDDARAYYDGSGNLIVLLKTLRRTDPA